MKYDIAIIGGGIIGCAVAHELSKYDIKICLIESEDDVGTKTTSANSAIVHSGYDCKVNTLKAEMNVLGNKMFTDWNKTSDVPLKRIGSLVLAFDDESQKTIEELYNQGIANGVPDLSIISAEQVKEKEPYISDNIKSALYAPTAGITSPYEAAIALAEHAALNGAQFVLNTSVVDIENNNGSFTIKTNNEDILCDYIINCAGLFADDVARMLGDDSFEITPRIGEYRLYDKNCAFYANSVLFQPPSKMGKGVLVSPTIHDNLIVGPNAIDVTNKTDTPTTGAGIDEIYQKAKRAIPTLPNRGVIRTFTGIRSIPSTDDFIIKPYGKNAVHAAGIASPGLSSAPAIAERVKDILISLTGKLNKKADYIPKRKGIVHFNSQTWERKAELIKQNPKYGRIICRCESITEAEILDALSRVPQPRSIDAIKRRTRASMGTCQGGFCTPRILEILKRELGMDMLDITKKGGKSYILDHKLKN